MFRFKTIYPGNIKSLLIILILNLIGHLCFSQTLRFQLTDEEDGTTVYNANIIVYQDGKTVVSDELGYFELPETYLGQEIKISHASYNYKRMILRIDSNIVLAMSRKYRPLRTIYLKSDANPHFNEWPIIKGARYKNGWNEFEQTIKDELKSKLNNLDSIKRQVNMEVSATGEMSLSKSETSDEFNIALKEIFSKLDNWEPGLQNQEKVRQFFTLEFESEEEKLVQIFTIVEEKPIPVGGMDALVKDYLSKIVYPKEALELGIEGRVFVQFIINEDGHLSHVTVLKGIGHGCDEEAIRVIKLSSPWIPGRQRGKPVKVRMILPITFKDIKDPKIPKNTENGF